ncbi:MAG: efflux RND transporter periplasmic adaptor subunit [Alistipes sp.]|nr:efflux RND transporter periplasmic adaptor subunit [Alistipes sp.]MBR0338933.1 efflux RND transporter periplasmic adaptor subunit [Alistipes sp.]
MKKNLLLGLMACLVASTLLVGCTEETSTTKRTREYNAMILKSTSRKLSSTYSATIRGKQDVDIRPKVQGYITDIKVKEGSIVRQGQTLFIIDQVPYQAALATAQANVDVAKAQVNAAELSATSKEKLFEQNIISDFDLRMARTNLASAKAQLAQARANELTASNNLSYTLVKSPVDGVVGTLPFRVGTLVSPSDTAPMTSVSDNSEMYVYFSMSESQVLSLKRQYGALENALQELPMVELQLSDGTKYSEKGRIEAISGIIDPTTGSVTLRAKFPNSKRLLISGGSGTVLLPHRQEGCVVIPQHATFEVQDKVYAYKYENGVAKAKIIGVFEISNGKEYIVESGLIEGDTIVVEGIGLLRDDTPIKIKEIVTARKK